jgi:RNA recognition motif-containing protein
MSDSARVYVGNCNFNTTRERLRAAFAAYGKIVDVHYVVDPATKLFRGLAFLTYSTPEEAQNAVDRADYGELDGRTLRVKIAEPRPPRARLLP